MPKDARAHVNAHEHEHARHRVVEVGEQLDGARELRVQRPDEARRHDITEEERGHVHVVHHEDRGHPVDAKRDIRQLDDDDDQEHRRDPKDPLDVDPDRGAVVFVHHPPPEASLGPLHDRGVAGVVVVLLLADDCLVKDIRALPHAEGSEHQHQGLEVIIDALECEEQQTADEHHERGSDEQEAGPDLAGHPEVLEDLVEQADVVRAQQHLDDCRADERRRAVSFLPQPVVHAQTDHERDVQHAVGELPHHGVERAQPSRVILQVLPGTQWFLWPPGAVR